MLEVQVSAEQRGDSRLLERLPTERRPESIVCHLEMKTMIELR